MDIKRIEEIGKTFQRMRKKNSDRFVPQFKAEKVKILVGYADGRYAVAAMGKDIPKEISSTSLISVQLMNHSQTKISGLLFSLCDESLLEIFISFVFDLESLANTDPSVSLLDIYNRYSFWQKMFKSIKPSVSENVLKGLLNELYLLEKYFIPKFGVYNAIKGWIGSDGSHKDFTFVDGTWFESKAINLGKISVQISSLEQLFSESKGYLVVSHLEKTSPNNFESLNLYSVFNLIKKKVLEESLLVEMYNKISFLGIDITALTDETKLINASRYIFQETFFYLVDDEFPRISRNKIPKAIGNICYELLLSEIDEFRTDYKVE
ncbi:PD-(D/E)XK motif protein [uncultured Enterococcus sp.]|uniref:PD-(D/E)XK motif protein n=1 Tax=uncultured Enterococcus sp. TaxID=167972 RepID=UPI002AA95D8A|nr:PD-(D/E)XK motif protein [uncultured Enterococcus sp.]